MRLVASRYASSTERLHAVPTDDAQAVLEQSQRSGQPIDGIDDLMSDVARPNGDELPAKIESGELLVVRDDAYYFDWGPFEQQVEKQKRAQRVSEISKHPLPEKKVEKLIVRMLDSVTGEPLMNRSVQFVTDRESYRRKTDALGIAYLSPAPPSESLATLQLQLTGSG